MLKTTKKRYFGVPKVRKRTGSLRRHFRVSYGQYLVGRPTRKTRVSMKKLVSKYFDSTLALKPLTSHHKKSTATSQNYILLHIHSTLS